MSPSWPTRWVVVDDSDPRVAYDSNGWTTRQTTSQKGSATAPFNNTVHVASQVSYNQFSFAFTGTAIQVYTNIVDRLFEYTNAVCTLDGNKPFSSSVPTSNATDFIFCQQSNLTDTTHMLQLIIPPEEREFHFDRIHYLPSKDASMESQTVYIHNADPSVNYKFGWSDGASVVTDYRKTINKGASLEFEFTGSSLQWYGVVPQNSSQAATINYTIDDLPPEVVDLLPVTSFDFSRQHKVFETSVLSKGNHKLSVVYNGDESTTPLTLDHLIVQNDSSITPSTDGATGSSSSTPKPGSASSSTARAVVASLSATGALAILAFLLYFCRRRRQIQLAHKDDRVHDTTRIEPFYTGHPSRGSDMQKLDLQHDSDVTTPHRYSRTLAPASDLPRKARREHTLTDIDPSPSQDCFCPAPDPQHTSNVPTNRIANPFTSPAGSPSSWASLSPVPQLLSTPTEDTRAFPSPEAPTPVVKHVRHHDSGLRMQDGETDRDIVVVELPPEYTPG